MERNDTGRQEDIDRLLAEVSKKYNRRILTTTDFEALSVVIEYDCGEMISASTLKRLWGYVSSHPSPRHGTLDVLCHYIGVKDFGTFCLKKAVSTETDSSYFTTKYVLSSDLPDGAVVLLKWNPNREIEVEYLGNFRYRVISNANSHLAVGDVFEATSFMVGAPLCIPVLRRGFDEILSYVAGSKGGITEIVVK